MILNAPRLQLPFRPLDFNCKSGSEGKGMWIECLDGFLKGMLFELIHE